MRNVQCHRGARKCHKKCQYQRVVPAASPITLQAMKGRELFLEETENRKSNTSFIDILKNFGNKYDRSQ